MTYILITSTGRIYTFYGLGCAEIYLAAYGGTLISNEVEETMTA